MSGFWENKKLAELTEEEWELLCDGCGKCCLHKLEDEDTGELYYTRVACSLFEHSLCRCTDYENRFKRVPDCMNLHTMSEQQFSWLPETCAYRLRAAGQALPSWHPLLSGDEESVHKAGASVIGLTVAEEDVDPDDFEDYIVHWVE